MNALKQTNCTATRVFVALGSNLGNPLQQIDKAALALGAHEHITRIAMSKVYQSTPHGVKDQPDYLNSVLEIRTTLTPEALLQVLQSIEDEHGRTREIRWGARTLDLDIILFDTRVIETATLTIPHPRAHEREFVVQPLFDLDSELVIPGQGKVSDLRKHLPIETLKEIRNVKTYNG